MNLGYVYRIVNLLDKKFYIGSSKRSERWREHRYHLRRGTHVNAYLQAAWNLHGERAFSFEILEKGVSIENIYEREQHWLDTTNAILLGYNLSKITKGSSMSEEAKQAMSKRLKGNQYTLGLRHTEESRRKMSLARKGIPKSAEHNRKNSEARRQQEALKRVKSASR